MATYTSYDQIGIKEDVSDIISNISPMTTPFQTMIRKGRVRNTVYNWQEDTLARVRDNAAVDGADATDATLSPTTLRENRTQIFEKTIKVSGTADAVDTYGRASELAYQSQKAAKEIKRDIEHALVGKVQNAAAGSSSVARRFGNVLGQDADSNALIGNVVAGTATSGSGLTEANLLTLHQTIFEEGADPTTLMVTPAHAQTVAAFAAASGRERDFGSRKEVVNAVDLYVSPYGELRVVLNRFLKRFIPDEGAVSETQIDPDSDSDSNPDSLGVALVFDPDMWELSTLRPITRTELARVGDARRFQLLGEMGLKHMNYAASGLLTNLNAS